MGNGLSASLGKSRRIGRSIAHNDVAARAESGPSMRGAHFSLRIASSATEILRQLEKENLGRVRRGHEHPSCCS
jgi:hypothetical protein